MDKQIFTNCIGMLQGQYGAINQERFKSLWDSLGNTLSNDEIMTATSEIIKTFIPSSACPFPVSAHFMAKVECEGDRAEHALKMILSAANSSGRYRMVSFGPAINGVIQRFGGWPDLCNWTREDWNINEGRFLAALRTAIKFNDGGPERLTCEHDRNGHMRDEDRNVTVYAIDNRGRISSSRIHESKMIGNQTGNISESVLKLSDKMKMEAA